MTDRSRDLEHFEAGRVEACCEIIDRIHAELIEHPRHTCFYTLLEWARCIRQYQHEGKWPDMDTPPGPPAPPRPSQKRFA